MTGPEIQQCTLQLESDDLDFYQEEELITCNYL